MTTTRESKTGVARFRSKLLVAMMLVVSAITFITLYFAQQNVAANVEHDLLREFQTELAGLHVVQQVRHAALSERCRALVEKPRIHAALEDNALELLYPSARDELRDVMETGEDQSPDQTAHALHARFYRFLDAKGAVLSPPNAKEVGELRADEEAQLTLKAAPDKQQIGYLPRRAKDGGSTIDEVIAMPIISTETDEVIATLVLGFKPVDLTGKGAGIKSGIWLNGSLHLPSLPESSQTALGREVALSLALPDRAESSLRVEVDGVPHLLFYKRLNPGSQFPPAYDVCIYPLNEMLERQRQLRWKVLGSGALLLLGGLVASNFLSGRLSRPVEKLAVDSEENRTQRERAEAALELTSEELHRSARFSADASHQLKTPVTVLRAGLEELLAQETVTPELREEIAALIHQTYRLTNIVEDLLLLSQMDAGRLRIEFSPVNLTQLIEACVDDLSARPDSLDLHVETEVPPAIFISGEKRYTTLILENLLDNARKYNHPGGRIRIAARVDESCARFSIGNTGRTISPAVQEHIFERFHRGAIGENVPGHGLGLNLARELARLHYGDLRLVRSDEGWTEFEARFRLAGLASDSVREVA